MFPSLIIISLNKKYVRRRINSLKCKDSEKEKNGNFAIVKSEKSKFSFVK